MRAQEFIVETKVGKITKRQRYATVGLNKFRDQQFADRVYELNRVMMAAACADGSDQPVEIEDQSWIGTRRSAHPYTEQEANMLKQAYRAAGAEFDDVNNGDMDSEEVDSVNRVSPIKAFAGY